MGISPEIFTTPDDACIIFLAQHSLFNPKNTDFWDFFGIVCSSANTAGTDYGPGGYKAGAENDAHTPICKGAIAFRSNRTGRIK